MPERFVWLFVGTYTQRETHVDGKGKGIYVYKFYPLRDNDILEFVHLAHDVGCNPSFLTCMRHRKSDAICVYAVNETSVPDNSSPRGKDTGYVRGFIFDEELAQLLPMQRPMPTKGSYPCHLGLSKSRDYLAVANYGGGNIALLPLDESTGRFTEQHFTFAGREDGSMVNAVRQDASHMHQALWASRPHDSSVDYLYGVDLGNDCIYQLELNKSVPMLQRIQAADDVARAPGSGPRNLVIHQTWNLAFVLDELSSTVGVHSIDTTTGIISSVETQCITTLSKDNTSANLAADIHISSCGNFLYVSNRGQDTITGYKINGNSVGRNPCLTLLGHWSTLGKVPRSFAIVDNFVFVGNQDSDTIHIFEILMQSTDAHKQGELRSTGFEVQCPTPVSFAFVEGKDVTRK